MEVRVKSMTVDLPEELIRKVRVRAAEDGRLIRETVADLLRKGLERGERDGKD